MLPARFQLCNVNTSEFLWLFSRPQLLPRCRPNHDSTVTPCLAWCWPFWPNPSSPAVACLYDCTVRYWYGTRLSSLLQASRRGELQDSSGDRTCTVPYEYSYSTRKYGTVPIIIYPRSPHCALFLDVPYGHMYILVPYEYDCTSACSDRTTRSHFRNKGKLQNAVQVPYPRCGFLKHAVPCPICKMRYKG